ncbi:hypothetical protein Clacol_006332 [Clathrus columnatus]|uniref:Uncharacterized protein n=1 Tax=Clathrus columnatus TaxID=1419009 RepID=A0AAV5ABS6_9AGAM|nr:hypothetical protein Clacol_006332 [Clathrus columnatus]
MNRARTTTTTETYTAHYNLSRTSEGTALKGPIKIWNPQPHNLLSESETESAPKRYHSHAHIAQSAPSAHQVVTNSNYSNHPSMSNSRSTSSYPHQRVTSPPPRRSERNVYAQPMEPSQPQPQPKPNTSVWNLNFIRPHRKETKAETLSSRRVDDLHRTAVTSSRHHQSSASNSKPVGRGPAPPVSYSSPSSAEPSPRNSTDSEHQTTNYPSEVESRRHPHTIWNPYVDSKLSSDYPTRKPDTVSTTQRIDDKKNKDRDDMVAKVTEAFSPPITTRSRVPETISLGQLSLLRGEDSGFSRRITPTGKASESQPRLQAYPPPSTSSHSRQRVAPQDFDNSTATDPRSKNYRQPTISTSRAPIEPPVRAQPTPTIPTPKASLPPPMTKPPVSTRTPFFAHLLMKKTQPSSRAASGPPPFNPTPANDQPASKQTIKEPLTRSVRTPTIPNPADPQVSLSFADHRPQQDERYTTIPAQSSKTHPRDIGPPVPPKQPVGNIKSAAEETSSRSTYLISKVDALRPTGNMEAVNQAYSRHLYTSPPPTSSANQYQYSSKSKPVPIQAQAHGVQSQVMVPTIDLQIKSPIIPNQSSTKPLPIPISSPALVHVPPVSAPTLSHSTVLTQQMQAGARLPTVSKSPTPPKSPPPVDLSSALIQIDKTITSSKLYERLPILENQVQPTSGHPMSLDDMNKFALVRPAATVPRSAPTMTTKEELISAGPLTSIPTTGTVGGEFTLTVPTTTTATSHSQSNSGHTTPSETIPRPTSVHIQWIPPAETETSSISSAEDEIIPSRRFTNTISQASVAAAIGTTSNKILIRSGETSYASQAPNLYVAPQSLSCGTPTPPGPGTQDVPRNLISSETPKKNPLSSAERPIAGAWTTKATANIPSSNLEALPQPPSKVENGVSFSRPAASTRLNGDAMNGKLLSIQAATATTNGSSVGMTPGAWTTVTKYNKPTIFEAEKKNELYVGNGQTLSSTMNQALNGTTSVGTWTTKVAQLDTQYSHHSDSNTTTPKLTPPHNPSPPSTTPRYQTTPATGSGSNTPSSSQSHSGTGLSLVERVPISGHPSTPAPSRPVLGPTPPPLSISSTTPDTDSLLTPSSLNSPRSTLLIPQTPPPPVPPPVTVASPRPPPNKEESSKNRILDLFRSKPTNVLSSNDVWVFPRQNSKEGERMLEEKKAKELPTSLSQIKARTTTITAVTQSLPPPRPKSPKLFSSLKLFSKRNRTMSTASMDALDGTTTTVMNSPSSSAPDIPGAPPSPPVRDALLATQEWRDDETNQFTKSKRPHRPGVTFDCPEDVAPIHMVPARFKLSRSQYIEDTEF